MRYLIVLLLAGCVGPTTGDVQWIGTKTESKSSRAPLDAAQCILQKTDGMQIFIGMTTTVTLRKNAADTWDVIVRTADGIAGFSRVAPAGSGSRIQTWATVLMTDGELHKAAISCE